jgi:hypothetical protein
VASVHQLQPRAAGPTLAEAVAAFCDTLDAWGTRRVYAGWESATGILDEPKTGAAVTAWFSDRWGGHAA